VLQVPCERLAVDPLHDHEEAAVVLAEVEDLRDMVVVDARDDARLVEEHRAELCRSGEVGADRLDGEELLETELPDEATEPDGAHPAARAEGEQLVPVEPGTGMKIRRDTPIVPSP
jgi:hypothetical protein